MQVKQKSPPTEDKKDRCTRSATDTPIVNKQGRLEVRWADHFSDVLNRPAPKIETEVEDPDTELDVTPHH